MKESVRAFRFGYPIDQVESLEHGLDRVKATSSVLVGLVLVLQPNITRSDGEASANLVAVEPRLHKHCHPINRSLIDAPLRHQAHYPVGWRNPLDRVRHSRRCW